ncbi:MAG TPA: arylsulfatase [Candidatus Brocadiia bacterium]|nr:arylsulfatase [Candidatus Brocadiia bacterium]
MEMNRRAFLCGIGAGAGTLALGSMAHADPVRIRPNIVFFFVDDMGYGDASCLNPEGRIRTPNLDRLARQGMILTDAHSSSAVCSPSRYSVLTGRYNWRSTLQKGIVGVYGNPLIAPNRMTVPGFLKRHGYHSACIGKWHLGHGWDFEVVPDIYHPKSNSGKTSNDVERVATPEERQRWRDSFSKPTTGGPTTRGFDYYFGVDVPNWPPYCYIENDRTVGIPSEFLPERLLGGNLASLPGPAMPYWHFEQLLPMWAEKADAYIRDRAATSEPFFLYMPMTSPHTPLAVNKPFIGSSGLNNLYADLVIETDNVLGRVLKSLEKHGVADNTLVIFASDNGCAPYIGCRVDGSGGEKAMEPQGHFPSGPFRGYKSDAWDGGHRIPCVVKWPGVIEPGSVSDSLVCLSDLMATCAEIVGEALPDDAGEDSVSMMPLFHDKTARTRANVVHHSIEGKFAIRDRKWKLVLCPGSGGWTHPDRNAAKEGLPILQLYDMESDPAEMRNLEATHRDKVKEMLALLKTLVADGRSTPGVKQTNDVDVDIWKLHTMPGVDPTALDDY